MGPPRITTNGTIAPELILEAQLRTVELLEAKIDGSITDDELDELELFKAKFDITL